MRDFSVLHILYFPVKFHHLLKIFNLFDIENLGKISPIEFAQYYLIIYFKEIQNIIAHGLSFHH